MTEELGAIVTTSMPQNDTLTSEVIYVKTKSTRQKQNKINFKRLTADILLWCALSIFTALGAGNAAIIQQHSSISLRYETPFSGQTAYQARQYAIEHSKENDFWPTFWTEDKSVFTAEYSEVDAACILFSGDAALVWSFEYLAGAMPGVADATGCAISSGLAWELWGDIDVMGKTLEVDGVPRAVRGVFDKIEALALLSVRDEDLTQSFTAVELSGDQTSQSRSSVESFVIASGLGMPDTVLMGTPTFLAEIMAMLPLIILAIFGFVVYIGWMKKRSVAIKKITTLILLLGAVILLPGLFDILPDWIIPTQWNDFSFWGSLSGQIGRNLREYLTLSYSLRDAEYATLFFRQISIAFASSGFSLFMCCRCYANSVFLFNSN